MINRKAITREQVMSAVRSGEFPPEIISSAQITVVVMTQDWCPQWVALKDWIYNASAKADTDVYEIVYNLEDYREEFMSFKERVWKNDQIPYLRFYCHGKLFRETNYVSSGEFAAILDSAL